MLLQAELPVRISDGWDADFIPRLAQSLWEWDPTKPSVHAAIPYPASIRAQDDEPHWVVAGVQMDAIERPEIAIFVKNSAPGRTVTMLTSFVRL
jgi:hypothetical protein